MRSLSTSVLSILFVATAALPQQTPPATEQQPHFGERIEVQAVLIDAVVTDSHGNQILGLNKDDFDVEEDGKPQKVDSVDYFTSRKLLNATETSAPFNVERVREDRYFVFFFDKPEGNELFGRVALARQAVNDFIDRRMTANDKVAIVGHDIRLKIYSDFTSDKKQLLAALDKVALFGPGVTSAPAGADQFSILRNLHGDELISETGTVYEAISALADALKAVKARKNLVLFSAGILEPSEEIRGGILLNRSRFYEPMVEALNAANVTVYSVNLMENPADAPALHQTLQSVALETNGQYYRYNVSFTPVVNQVVKATAGYYLLTYRTEKRGRGFQKVSVSIKNHPEFHVTARAGYSYGD